MRDVSLTIVSTADRPDLVPVVAGWLWQEFWQPGGHPLAATEAAVREAPGAAGLPRCLVLLADGVPVGTASLTADDLPERPDLSPWLASVFVAPAARGRGHAGRLVAAVEAAARDGGWATLWLYTVDAERIYARAGWRRVAEMAHQGARGPQKVVLMTRALGPKSAILTPK